MGNKVQLAWSPAAKDKCDQVLQANALQLNERAADVATAREADTVSEAFVAQAAIAIGIAPQPRVRDDVLLANGPAIFSLALGVWLPFLIAPPAAGMPDWVAPVLIAILCIGSAITAAAITLKAKA